MLNLQKIQCIFLKQPNVKYSLNRMFDFDVMRGNEQAWFAGENGSISIVRKTMKKNNILFTRRASEVKEAYLTSLLFQRVKTKHRLKVQTQECYLKSMVDIIN